MPTRMRGRAIQILNDAVTSLLLFGAVAIQAAALFYAWRVITGLHEQLLAIIEGIAPMSVAPAPQTQDDAIPYDDTFYPDAGQDVDLTTLAAASADAADKFLGDRL